MKKLFVAVALLTFAFPSFAWDKLGHDISATIAWNNMTPKARKNIVKYLEGQNNIVYYASWMDFMGSATKSGYSNTGHDHLVPVNDDFEYAEGEFPGDALRATEIAIERLGGGKYKNLDDSTVLLLIKHLVHFLPDMHCPSHVIYKAYPDSFFKLNYKGKNETFHGIWDKMTSYGPHAWSATEWCMYLDNRPKTEKNEIVKGTPREWVKDNARTCIIAYDIIKPQIEITAPERFRGNLLAEKQLLKGGLRLAYVLNQIFG